MAITGEKPARGGVWPYDRAGPLALLVLGVALGMYGGFAVTFIQSFGVFIKPISQDLGWGRAQASVITIMGFLGFSLASPILGALVDRLGMSRVFAIGILMFAAGMAALSVLPGNIGAFAVCAFLIGAFGSAVAPTGYVLIVSKLVRQRLGLAIGLSMIGLGIGAATIPSVAQALIDRFGWRGGYLGLAAIGLVLGAIAWTLIFAIRKPPSAPPAEESVSAATPATGLSLKQALASHRFWIIVLTGVLAGGAGFGASAHLAAALSDRGLTAQTAAQAAGVMGLGVFVGRTGSAILMDKVFAPLVACAGFVLGGAGLFLVAHAPTTMPGLLFGAAFITGLLTGTEGDVMPILSRRYFGLASFGKVYGCIVGLVGLGGILGPLVFGVGFDRSQSYEGVLTVGAAICVLSGLSMLLMGSYPFPPPEDRR